MTRTEYGKFTSYRYVAAGVYDGELKTLSRALRAGDLSVVGRAADILSPLVGDARCIVPMPSRNGLPNAVNALCEAVSSRTGLPVVNALGTKTERVSMCDAKRALRNRTAARLPYPEELMMFRKSDAEAGSAVCQKLSEEFIEKFADKVNWVWISINQKLSEDFIERFADKVNWRFISAYQKLSEKFIEKHADKVNWGWISRFQQLSEPFIEKFADKVDWGWISATQKLSENFIEQHADKVDWEVICEFQKLSEAFIERHADRLNR